MRKGFRPFLAEKLKSAKIFDLNEFFAKKPREQKIRGHAQRKLVVMIPR